MKETSGVFDMKLATGRYPNVLNACQALNDFVAKGGSVDDENEPHWRTIFAAAQKDGVIPKTAKYEDFNVHAKKDLSECLIDSKTADPFQVMAIMLGLGTESDVDAEENPDDLN